MKLTYQQAYDKIIDAYFKDEIRPNHAEFCFCGTLCNNSDQWYGFTLHDHNDFNGYAGKDFVKMERALFAPILEINDEFLCDNNTKSAGYEDALFAGMSAALDVLKEIHRSRGEDVDNISQPFTKRQLANH